MQALDTNSLLRADRSFFQQPPTSCARQLIGALLLWDGFLARIVETEAYAATDDPACHTFSRPSARAFVTSYPPGAAYVYFNYGFHWLFNLLTLSPAADGFVLFRALELVRTPPGLESLLADPRVCAGPGKLTRTLGINRSHHGLDLCQQPDKAIFFEKNPAHRETEHLLIGPRIGIRRATDLPWRFGLAGSPALSKPFPRK